MSNVKLCLLYSPCRANLELASNALCVYQRIHLSQHLPFHQSPRCRNYFMEVCNLQYSTALLPHCTAILSQPPKRQRYSYNPFPSHSLQQPPSGRHSLLCSRQLTRTILRSWKSSSPTQGHFLWNSILLKHFCEIHNSEFLDQHIGRIADSLGTGGLLAYLQIWNHYIVLLVPMSHANAGRSSTISLLLDYLHASDHLKRRKDSRPSRTRMMTHIKALRWMALKLDLPLHIPRQSQTVSDFLKSQTRIPFERSEASPIPLAVLAAWELRILSQKS